jgi:7-cyano-7-deazaguanine synthase
MAERTVTDRIEETQVAVLAGGVDSAVLAVHLLKTFDRVIPIYVRCELRWETTELAGLRAFLEGVKQPRLAPLRVLDEPIADAYGEHWSTVGSEVPDATSPDKAVYLPGRNLLLLAKAAVWCRLRGIRSIALGTLASNPFPDSTPRFDRNFETLINVALGARITLVRPFAGLNKAEVLRLGEGLPLWLTFSCLQPIQGRHCGQCNKCAERRKGFRDAGLADWTAYASERMPVPCTE